MKSKLSCDTSLKKWKWKKWKWKMWNQSFRARPPSKSERGRYENEAFVRDFLQNRQIPKVEEVKTKLSRETSLKIWKWKMWKRSFCARLPPDSDSWRCENKAFVRDLCQIRTVEDVKTKLSWETSVKIVKIGSDSWRYENKAFVRDLPQKVKVEDVKTKLSCKTSFKFWKFKLNKTMPETAVPLRGPSDHDPSTPEPFRNPPAGQASPSIFRDRFCPAIHSISCIRYLSKTHFVRDFPQRVKVEDVKTKLSCETSLKIWKGQIWKRWKMWKRSFRARLPPDSDSWRCENEAFVRDLPQNLKVEDVKAKLLCETSLKIWKWKMWKRSSRERLPPDSDSWRCENKAFVRDLCQIRTVEDVKTKLSWETSVKIVKIGSDSWRYENKAFVRDLPQKVKVEDVKTKLSCKTSFKFWKFKLSQTMPETAVPLRGRSDHDPSTLEPLRNPPAVTTSLSHPPY